MTRIIRCLQHNDSFTSVNDKQRQIVFLQLRIIDRLYYIFLNILNINIFLNFYEIMKIIFYPLIFNLFGSLIVNKFDLFFSRNSVNVTLKSYCIHIIYHYEW